METPGRLVPGLIDVDRAEEFTGDDVDRFSELVDLEGYFSKVLVFIPALDASGIVSLYLQKDKEVTTVPSQLQAFDADGTGHFAHATSSGAGGVSIVFNTGAIRWLRVHVSENQAADRTFYLRGC